MSAVTTNSVITSYVQADHSDFKIIADEECKKDPFDALLLEYREIVVNSLITAFGLDKLLFLDIDGGNVQTIHNAENRVYSNETFRERGEREYNRNDYASPGYMNQRRKNDFKNKKQIDDGYRDVKDLPKDGRTHLEHVVSAKENHENTAFRILFDADEMSEIINDKNNTIYTDSSLNQSKGESSLSNWLNQQKKGQDKKNAERFGVNRKKSRAKDKKARKFINEKIARRKIEHYAKSMTTDSLSQGGKMAVRQALGVVFTELTMTIWDELPIIREKCNSKYSVDNFFDCVVDIIKKGFKRVEQKLNAIVDAFKNGFVSGFFNSIVVTIINMFLTTSKNLIKIIRQAMTSITEAVRILFFDKENRSVGERLTVAVKILLTSAATVIGVILEQTLNETLTASGLSAIPVIGPSVVDSISVFSGILLTGILSVTFLYVLDNSEVIKKIIKFIDYIFTDGIAKVGEKMDAANSLLDDYIAKLCEIDVSKLKDDINKLHSLNLVLLTGDLSQLYEYCESSNIDLQFKNSEEFRDFMNDDDSVFVL